jgi:hypothetical protein
VWLKSTYIFYRDGLRYVLVRSKRMSLPATVQLSILFLDDVATSQCTSRHLQQFPVTRPRICQAYLMRPRLAHCFDKTYSNMPRCVAQRASTKPQVPTHVASHSTIAAFLPCTVKSNTGHRIAGSLALGDYSFLLRGRSASSGLGPRAPTPRLKVTGAGRRPREPCRESSH